jgi:hypothetical protein
MKTTLHICLAFMAAVTLNAQQNPAPEQPPAPPKSGNQGCVWVTPPPPPKLPSKWQQEIDRRKAEFERKTGIVLPPPPPPKPKLVCPPAAKTPAPAPVTDKQ